MVHRAFGPYMEFLTMAVKEGDTIKIEYTGKLADGTVFDASEKHGKPLEFTVGSGQVIKGMDDGVVGMEKEESKTIQITKDEAYGDPNPQLIQKIPKDKFPEGQDIQVGMMLHLNDQSGRHLHAFVTEIGDADVTIDLNHPLAGKDLTFDVKVVEIGASDDESEESSEDEE